MKNQNARFWVFLHRSLFPPIFLQHLQLFWFSFLCLCCLLYPLAANFYFKHQSTRIYPITSSTSIDPECVTVLIGHNVGCVCVWVCVCSVLCRSIHFERPRGLCSVLFANFWFSSASKYSSMHILNAYQFVSMPQDYYFCRIRFNVYR